MRTIFILGIIALGTAGAAACKKSSKTNTTTIDSLDIHQTGGFAGVNNHFRITTVDVRMGRTVNNTIVYDSLLPATKHAQVKGLLNTIPKDMVSNNEQAVQNGNDIMYQSIVSYKAGTAYTYHLNPEKSLNKYAADVYSATTILTTP